MLLDDANMLADSTSFNTDNISQRQMYTILFIYVE